MLGCFAPNLTDFTFANIIEGAETEARKQGYFLVSSSTPDEDTFSILIDELVGSRRIEGLMVINPYMDARHALLPQKFPAVFVGARPRDEAVSSVALDDRGAARDATCHLIELGHQRIAMVTGPMSEDCSQDRCQGFEDALQAAALAYDPELVVAGDWSASSGYQALQQLVSRTKLPSAVFAQNDRMAVGVIQAAREMGLDVPGALSVIGVDDMPLASYFDPPLSTMSQDTQAIGRAAARLLIRAVEQPQTSYQHLLISAELISRVSTGPFRA
jgi:LacI family repressor for deo operon, udp, cdd, tsx, nupC, and nupG